MSVRHRTEEILRELEDNVLYLNDGQMDEFIEQILSAQHIFIAGAGRSGVMAQAFSNRLMHLGFSVSVVGEVTSPHSKAGDLLIIVSGSGETESLADLAHKAVQSGVKTALVTMDGRSSIAQAADTIVVLPGVSPKLVHEGMNITSIQPMGTAFEQMCLLTFDAMVLELMEQMKQDSLEMFARHADFE